MPSLDAYSSCLGRDSKSTAFRSLLCPTQLLTAVLHDFLSHSRSLYRGHAALRSHFILFRQISTENGPRQLHNIVGRCQHLTMAFIAKYPEDQDRTPAKVVSEHDSKQNGSHDTPLSPFLDLPAELRNSIYRLCLIDRPRFSIRVHDAFKFPALLQVNSQIRSEASSIFLLENHFSVDCSNFDCSLYTAFIERTAVAKHLQNMRLRSRVLPWIADTSDMVWSSLLQWLRVYYNDPDTLRPFVTRFGCLQRETAAHAFDVVKRVRAKMAWADILKLLEVFKDVTELQANGSWKWT